MRKFIFRVVFFLLIPLGICCLLLQSFIDDKLAKSNQSYYKEWNDILNSKINADIIIQGSSRAWFQISPYVIDSVLSSNSYNLGVVGYEFLMQYYRFNLYVKYNKKPKYIIQSIDQFTLTKRDGLYMLEQFIPYLNNDIIKEAVSNYEGFDFRDFYIPCYKYTHTLYTKELILKSFNPISFDNYKKFKGFHEQNILWDSSFDNFKNKNKNGYRIHLDEFVVSLFKKYLDYCKKENIKIIFINTPEYNKAQKLLLNRDSINDIFKKYSFGYNIPFLDYSNDSICLDTINFYNSQHLNALGVKKFNLKLASDLKKIIK